MIDKQPHRLCETMHCGDEHQRSEHAPQPTPPTGDAAISTSNPGICSSLDRQHHEIRITSKSAPGVGNDSNPANPSQLPVQRKWWHFYWRISMSEMQAGSLRRSLTFIDRQLTCQPFSIAKRPKRLLNFRLNSQGPSILRPTAPNRFCMEHRATVRHHSQPT